MIGIVLENLKSFDLDILNNSCDKNTIVFTDCVLPPKEYRNLSFFTTCLAYDFSGILVSTCINSSMAILDMPLAKRKFFIIPQSLWINEEVAYNILLDIYNNDKLELLATTKEQADIVSNFFKKPTVIQSVLDIKEI
jgi:hypothetical protein|tara:strand:- start:431 stop:841 length:411 start_codon:yes stop_codon:yes gene_type:complete